MEEIEDMKVLEELEEIRLYAADVPLHGEKPRNQTSFRLSEKELEIIKRYPGKNLSAKLRNLLRNHKYLVQTENGEDLSEETYEYMILGYLEDWYPSMKQEIKRRRKQISEARETLKEIEEIRQKVKKIQQELDRFCDQTSEMIEIMTENYENKKKKGKLK